MHPEGLALQGGLPEVKMELVVPLGEDMALQDKGDTLSCKMNHAMIVGPAAILTAYLTFLQSTSEVVAEAVGEEMLLATSLPLVGGMGAAL